MRRGLLGDRNSSNTRSRNGLSASASPYRSGCEFNSQHLYSRRPIPLPFLCAVVWLRVDRSTAFLIHGLIRFSLLSFGLIQFSLLFFGLVGAQ
jgi:hypothetical protein